MPQAQLAAVGQDRWCPRADPYDCDGVGSRTDARLTVRFSMQAIRRGRQVNRWIEDDVGKAPVQPVVRDVGRRRMAFGTDRTGGHQVATVDMADP